MNHIATSALLITLLIPAAKASAGDTCDFDQAAVLQELVSKAKANPGGVLDANNHRVAWKDASGRTVQISHAGCMDLGSSVKVSFPESTDTRTAVAALMLATSNYWSPIQANEASRILGAGQFTTSRPAPGSVEFEVDKEASPAFPFGFTLEVKSDRALLSWQQL
ncbi:hypothetical protein JR064_19065 [Xanthomonas sp. CFBP 8703]|uniref:Secreted protein n=1 Tax=Xanthomonas bonasiae TaxID=2810351 RepID=A0ABS3B7F3_9XANT|nr:hypothetical protein [Xanthomonas bonasiae]MBN6104268.1 hypothetical protein [Xanthomonas bonasiae]